MMEHYSYLCGNDSDIADMASTRTEIHELLAKIEQSNEFIANLEEDLKEEWKGVAKIEEDTDTIISEAGGKLGAFDEGFNPPEDDPRTQEFIERMGDEVELDDGEVMQKAEYEAMQQKQSADHEKHIADNYALAKPTPWRDL